MSYGQDAKIGLSFQNSYGTVNVASLHWLEPIQESVTLKKAQIKQKGMRGIYDAGQVQEGVNTVAGDISVEAKANELGVLLSAVCVSSLAITSGALYQHVFRPRQSDHNPMCAERPFSYLKNMGDGGSAHQYSDLCGSNLELAIANGELLTAKMGVVGGAFARIAGVAATYSISNPIDWSVSSIMLGGVALNAPKSLTVTQDNNLAPIHTVGVVKTPARIKRSGERTISIAGTLLFEDQVEAAEFINQTDQRLVIVLTGTTNVQSGYPEMLIIDVPAMRYTEFPMVVGNPGQTEVGFKAVAQYHAGSGCAIQYTLNCGKAGF